MTITIQPARNEFTANAGQTIFNYTFKIFSATDLNVYITPAGQDANDSTDLTTAFTVSGVGLPAGGSITLATPTNLNDLVTIVSNVPSTRTTDYQNNGDFRPDTVNDDFDRVVSIAKKVEDLSNRALLTEQSQQGLKPLSLINPVAQALLRWKSDLSGVENVFFSDLSPTAVPNDLILLNSTLTAVIVDPNVKVGQVYVLSDRANGIFKIISGTGSANLFNIVTHTTLSLSVELISTGVVDLKAFGFTADGTDDTAAWNVFEPQITEGDKVLFYDGVYKGKFFTKKAIKLVCEDATFINASANVGIIRIGPEVSDFTAHVVTESTLNYLGTTFTVSGASTKFVVGDIGYLWDNAMRPSDNEQVNFEMIKILSIATDIITVEGFIHSFKGAGAITFNHSTIQPKNVEVTGFRATPDNTHVFFALRVFGVDGTTFRDSITTNTVGNAVSARFCYNFRAFNTVVNNPRITTSGDGYGVAMIACTRVTVKDLFGRGTRHILDADSVYDFLYENIHELDDQSIPIDFGHDGFTGHGVIRDIFVTTPQHAVNLSEGGYGSGANRAEKKNHPLRRVDIDNVNVTIQSSIAPDDGGTRGVFIRTNVKDVNINNISIRHINQSALTVAATSNIVRVNGIAIGHFSMTNLSTDKIGRFFFSSGDDDGVTFGNKSTYMRRLTADAVNKPVEVQGKWQINIDDIAVSIILSDSVVSMQQNAASDNPEALFIGSNINYGGTSRQLFDIFVTVPGENSGISRDSNTVIVLTAGYNFTATEIQNRMKFMRILAPVAGGTLIVGAFPKPFIDGQILVIEGHNSGRQDILIPGTLPNINEDILFNAAKPGHMLVSAGGLWRLSKV